MTVPNGPAPHSTERLEQDVAKLQRDFEELQRRTLYSAAIGAGGLRVHSGGSFRVESGFGFDVFYVGTGPIEDKSVVEVHRHNGSVVMRTGVYEPNGEQYFALYDRQGNILFSDDAASGYGMANPWLSIPLYPRFSMAASSVYSYMNLPVSSVTSETTLWSGRIPQLHHGYIGIDGVWGQATGSNSSTYRLKVNNTTVGTWSETGLTVANRGPFDIHTLINSQWLGVDLTVQASGTGNVASQVLGVTLRGS
ncbi:hypothetical protein DMH04_41270 [Kibdelosporangium aridum]|uniref:Uncharacterized protein n=1 Tax=Kibdelosporangium aridum TaxID=2030 RepID=A0A428YUW9_KIBAR|nr:hypothetical protein [Kibdelosporangium aridum]RSM73445.1 hypothetical protein DMH04_41270 [Kibdelosporangium aridum]